MKEYRHEFAEYIDFTESSFQQFGGIIPIRAGNNRASRLFCQAARHRMLFAPKRNGKTAPQTNAHPHT